MEPLRKTAAPRLSLVKPNDIAPQSTPARLRPVWPHADVAPGVFAHRNGQWAKKANYRLCYFGVVSDPDAALRRYLSEFAPLHDGQSTPARLAESESGTLFTVVNEWLNAQLERCQQNDLSAATYRDYCMVGQWIGDTLGWYVRCEQLTPLEWSRARRQLAEKYKTPSTIAKFVIVTQTCLRWAADAELIKPMHFGPDWRQPSKRAMRLHKYEQQRKKPRLLHAAEIRTLLAAAGDKLAAMILLGINCGYGQRDISSVRIEDVHFSGRPDQPSMLSNLRHKTAVRRSCVLWPETAAALRAVIGARPSGLAFLTKQKRPFVRIQPNRRDTMTPIDSVALEYRKVCRAAGVSDTRFYSLRHTFRTLAEQTKHQRAIDMIMGHVGGDGGADWKPSRISGEYVHSIEVKLLAAVSEHVRSWLGMPDKAATEGTESTETVSVRISR